MGEVQPYQVHTVQSEVGGTVKKISINKEFSYIFNPISVVRLDTSSEDISIKMLNSKIAILKEALKLKRANLKSKKGVRQISKYDINREALSVVDTKLALNSAEMELKLKKDIREKKIFYLSNGYLGKIYVDEFEFVPMGGKLFDYYDFSKSKIVIYVGEDEVQGLKNKTIFINEKKSSDWKIEKISRVKDSKRISTYEVRLVKRNRVPSKAQFGKIYKVEFR